MTRTLITYKLNKAETDAPPVLLSDHEEALIKETRARVKFSREDSEREAKMVRSRTVADGPFRCRYEGDGQGGKIELHIQRLIGQLC